MCYKSCCFNPPYYNLLIDKVILMNLIGKQYKNHAVNRSYLAGIYLQHLVATSAHTHVHCYLSFKNGVKTDL